MRDKAEGGGREGGRGFRQVITKAHLQVVPWPPHRLSLADAPL